MVQSRAARRGDRCQVRESRGTSGRQRVDCCMCMWDGGGEVCGEVAVGLLRCFSAAVVDGSECPRRSPLKQRRDCDRGMDGYVFCCRGAKMISVFNNRYTCEWKTSASTLLHPTSWGGIGLRIASSVSHLSLPANRSLKVRLYSFCASPPLARVALQMWTQSFGTK